MSDMDLASRLTKSVVRSVRVAKAGWSSGKHPRGYHGRFIAGPAEKYVATDLKRGGHHDTARRLRRGEPLSADDRRNLDEQLKDVLGGGQLSGLGDDEITPRGRDHYKQVRAKLAQGDTYDQAKRLGLRTGSKASRDYARRMNAAGETEE